MGGAAEEAEADRCSFERAELRRMGRVGGSSGGDGFVEAVVAVASGGPEAADDDRRGGRWSIAWVLLFDGGGKGVSVGCGREPGEFWMKAAFDSFVNVDDK